MRKYILVRRDGVTLSASNSARTLETLRAELASQQIESEVFAADDPRDDAFYRREREDTAVDHFRDLRKHDR